MPRMTYKSRKVGQTNLWSEFFSMHAKYYKSPRVAAVKCVTLVNTQTHRHAESFWPVILLAQPAA